MLKPHEALDRAENLVSQAIKAGADAADAVYVCDASTEVQVRLGALEDVARSEGEEIGLRVFVGQRSATISSSSLNPSILANLVSRAIDMAKEAPEDQYAGLASQDRLLKGDVPDLDVDDGQDPDPALLRAAALECEDAARAVAGVTNSEGAGASAARSIFALATSHGFAGVKSSTGYGLSASVLAGEGAALRALTFDVRQAGFAELHGPAAASDHAGAFDLVMSATAFHWIAPEIGYPKAAAALKPTGSLAIFAHEHLPLDPAFAADLHAIEQGLTPEWPDPRTPPDLETTIAASAAALDATGLFAPAVVRTYPWARRYSAEEFVRLHNTFSNYRSLSASTRAEIFRAIAGLIGRHYAGAITKSYLAVLYMARKAAE